MKIGFIGFGEAAFELAQGLKEEGVKEFFAYDPMANVEPFSQVIADRLTSSGTQICDTPQKVAEQSGLLIVAVPANKTLDAAKTVSEYLKADTIYVDVSASTPAVKKSVSKTVASKGAHFVDVAMMGPLPIYKHKVPMLVSGNGAKRFIDLFESYDMDITKVGDEAGDASSIKLIRSVFMKGLAALLIETLTIAKNYNVETTIVDSISGTVDSKGFKNLLTRLVTGTAIHSERRSAEIEGSIKLLDEVNLSSIMTNASKEKLDYITNTKVKEHFHAKTPDQWERVIEFLIQDSKK